MSLSICAINATSIRFSSQPNPPSTDDGTIPPRENPPNTVTTPDVVTAKTVPPTTTISEPSTKPPANTSGSVVVKTLKTGTSAAYHTARVGFNTGYFVLDVVTLPLQFVVHPIGTTFKVGSAVARYNPATLLLKFLYRQCVKGNKTPEP